MRQDKTVSGRRGVSPRQADKGLKPLAKPRRAVDLALACLEKARAGTEVVFSQPWTDLMNSEAFYRWILSALEEGTRDGKTQ